RVRHPIRPLRSGGGRLVRHLAARGRHLAPQDGGRRRRVGTHREGDAEPSRVARFLSAGPTPDPDPPRAGVASRWPLVLRALAAAAALPGTAVVLVPWLLVSRDPAAAGPEGCRLVGFLPLALGAGALAWCIVDFARVGKGTLAPVDPPTTIVR